MVDYGIPINSRCHLTFPTKAFFSACNRRIESRSGSGKVFAAHRPEGAPAFSPAYTVRTPACVRLAFDSTVSLLVRPKPLGTAALRLEGERLSIRIPQPQRGGIGGNMPLLNGAWDGFGTAGYKHAAPTVL